MRGKERENEPFLGMVSWVVIERKEKTTTSANINMAFSERAIVGRSEGVVEGFE